MKFISNKQLPVGSDRNSDKYLGTWRTSMLSEDFFFKGSTKRWEIPPKLSRSQLFLSGTL